ncbi:MAG: spermidine synthase [Zestosphaera tikiterensis]|uniref:Polyamine aminopropyltransferase n=1 Tax=Zestosphaera tikiterensis TaxID=1973259 RepID=A0A2R7Y576_9CREN|nr:MAG: spermidine synthase [Zestosphaera tikiterensis]
MRLGPALIQGVSKNSVLVSSVKQYIIIRRTKYQEAQILEFDDFGKALVLDGYIQSTEFDEFMYHESLVHPAMVAHPRPENVLIIGGGEGATLREVLKHNVVKKAVMVDIDGELVELAKEYLGFMHQGSFNDSRAEVIIEDGLKYVEKAPKNFFDVVVLDLTDPYGPEIGRLLYSTEFYAKVKTLIKTPGIVVTQAGNSFFFPEVYEDVLNSMKRNFSVVREYWTWIPSFGYACNFIVGSDGLDPRALTESKVNETLKLRGVATRYYDGRQHEAFFKNKVVVGVRKG